MGINRRLAERDEEKRKNEEKEKEESRESVTLSIYKGLTHFLPHA